jgi:class 3 adenylate cyclase
MIEHRLADGVLVALQLSPRTMMHLRSRQTLSFLLRARDLPRPLPIGQGWKVNELPTGTVTLVFTDIEGSTRLSRQTVVSCAKRSRRKTVAPPYPHALLSW